MKSAKSYRLSCAGLESLGQALKSLKLIQEIDLTFQWYIKVFIVLSIIVRRDGQKSGFGVQVLGQALKSHCHLKALTLNFR